MRNDRAAKESSACDSHSINAVIWIPTFSLDCVPSWQPEPLQVQTCKAQPLEFIQLDYAMLLCFWLGFGFTFSFEEGLTARSVVEIQED